MAGNLQIFHNAMKDGDSAAWDQDWELAKHYYIAALEEFPNNPEALVNLGLALFEMGDLDQALLVYRRAAAVSPEDPAPQEKMAQIYETMGRKNEAVRAAMQAADLFLKTRDIEKAIESWEHITDLHPDSLTAHTRLAMIFERLGRKNEAVLEYLAAASQLQRNGDPARATQVVMYALNLAPGNPEATEALRQLKIGQSLKTPARARVGQKRTATPSGKASEPTRLATPKKLDPIAEALQHAMVELAGSLFDQAEEDFGAELEPTRTRDLGILTQEADYPVEVKNRTQILLHIGQAIEAQTHGQEEQAAEELENTKLAGFTSPALEFDLGYLQAERDEVQALRALNAAVQSTEYAMAAYLVMGRVHYNLKEYNAAAAACLQALRLADAATVPEPQRVDLRQLYDPIIENQTRATDQAALQGLCDTVFSYLIRPDWLELMKKARQQLLSGRPDELPVPLAEMLLEIRSVNVIDALAYIRTLSAQGKLRTAREEAFRAISKAPTYLPLHIQMGDLLLQEGQQAEALKKYLLIARLYTLRGERTQAISLLERVQQIAPMDLEIRDQLIDLLVAEGRVDEAIQNKINLARANYQFADLDGARQVYQSTLRLVPESRQSKHWAFKILNELTDIDMQRLDWRSALGNLEQMRTLQPEDAGTRARIIDLNYRLGQTGTAIAEVDQYLKLVETRNNEKAAEEFLLAQIQDHPERVELRLKLVEYYRRKRNVGAMIDQLDALASAYADAGQPARAATMVEEIIRLNPPNRADYEAALRQLRRATAG